MGGGGGGDGGGCSGRTGCMVLLGKREESPVYGRCLGNGQREESKIQRRYFTGGGGAEMM